MYQPLKWYLWPMACFTDPSFSEQRIELTKSISLIYIIDDIFDVYGTLDQLTLFRDAVNRYSNFIYTTAINLNFHHKVKRDDLFKIFSFSSFIFLKYQINKYFKKSFYILLRFFILNSNFNLVNFYVILYFYFKS